ncbi:MAG: rhodanese-like domain-containing protein [Polyangiaceae bacterium]
MQNVSAAQAQELIARGEVEVIDVRDLGEWATGHIEGARHVPLEVLRANPKAILPASNVLFVCAGGVRSQTAARVAEQYGITKVYNLTTGTRGWAKAGFALQQDRLSA